MSALLNEIDKQISAGNEDLYNLVNLIKHKVKFIEHKPAILYITNISPFQIRYDNELVNVVGGQLIENPGKFTDAEIVIAAPGNTSITESLAQVGNLFQLPFWNDITAIKEDRFFIVNTKNDLPADLNTEIEILAEIIHPKQFVFGHEGKRWLKFGL